MRSAATALLTSIAKTSTCGCGSPACTKIGNIPVKLLRYRHYAGQVSNRHAVEQAHGAAIARLAYDERKAGRPDPTEHLAQLPPIDSLDASVRPQGRFAGGRGDDRAAAALFARCAAVRRVRPRRPGSPAPVLTNPTCGARLRASSVSASPSARCGSPPPGARGMSGVAPLDDAPLPQASPVHDRGTASVKGAALWAAANQYCQFALQFVTSVLISRFFLQPEEVGLFSVALAAAMLFAVLQDFGLTRYLGTHPTADEGTVKSALVVAVLFAVALAALILGLAWPIAGFYGDMRLSPILALIAGSYLLVPFSLVPLRSSRAGSSFARPSRSTSPAPVAGSAAALGLAAAGFRPPRSPGR